MSNNWTAKRLVEDATAIVEAGWCQNKHEDVDKCGNKTHCLRGAVLKAVVAKCGDSWCHADSSAFFGAHEAIRNTIKSTTEFQDACAFNDHPGRTKEEVVSLMRSVAESM